MPTASTAQILGNNESIEPYTSNIYTRRVLSGEFQVRIWDLQLSISQIILRCSQCHVEGISILRFCYYKVAILELLIRTLYFHSLFFPARIWLISGCEPASFEGLDRAGALGWDHETQAHCLWWICAGEGTRSRDRRRGRGEGGSGKCTSIMLHKF